MNRRQKNRIISIYVSIFAIILAIGIWLWVIHTPSLEPNVTFQVYAPTKFINQTAVKSLQANETALRKAHSTWYEEDIAQIIAHVTVTAANGDKLSIIEQRWKTPTLVCDGMRFTSTHGIGYCVSNDQKTLVFTLHKTLITTGNLSSNLSANQRSVFIESFRSLHDVPLRVVSDPMGM